MARDDDDIEDDVNRLLRDLEPGWEATVTNGTATICGPGPDREAEAAASLAADRRGGAPGPRGPAPPVRPLTGRGLGFQSARMDH